MEAGAFTDSCRALSIGRYDSVTLPALSHTRSDLWSIRSSIGLRTLLRAWRPTDQLLGQCRDRQALVAHPAHRVGDRELDAVPRAELADRLARLDALGDLAVVGRLGLGERLPPAEPLPEGAVA